MIIMRRSRAEEIDGQRYTFLQTWRVTTIKRTGKCRCRGTVEIIWDHAVEDLPEAVLAAANRFGAEEQLRWSEQ